MTATALLVCLPSTGLEAQRFPPVFEGVAYLDQAPLTEGLVVLHHIAEGAQGNVDSVEVTGEGAFSFVLPTVPTPARNEVYFASVRHGGVLYFSAAITAMTQLDSVYTIQVYDTLVASPGGHPIPLQSRSVFFEPDTVGWRVTELYQLRNDENRTVVSGPGGYTWSHALPAEATRVVAGEGEISPDAAVFEDGALVVRAAIPPGERIFVVQYWVDSPLITIPSQGSPELLDVLIREPAPALDVEGLELVDRIELEAGSTYMRFSGTEFEASEVRVVPGEEVAEPRVEWVAFLLALVLAASGLFVLRPTASPQPAEVPTSEPLAARRALLEQVAHLDEEFERSGAPDEQKASYERRRAELLRQLALLN